MGTTTEPPALVVYAVLVCGVTGVTWIGDVGEMVGDGGENGLWDFECPNKKWWSRCLLYSFTTFGRVIG